jgi:UDP-glucose 4-epimerase
MAGKSLAVNGDGLQTRDFVYAGDLAQLGPTLVLMRPVGVFNLATGVETTILELATKIGKAFGREDAIHHAPANNGEQRRSVLSSAKAMQILRWTPETKLDQGLAQTRDWLRANPSA